MAVSKVKMKVVPSVTLASFVSGKELVVGEVLVLLVEMNTGGCGRNIFLLLGDNSPAV